MSRAKKQKRLKAIYIDGKPHCPKCKTRNWDVIKGIVNDGDDGMFKFEGECRDCGNIVIYHSNI